MRKLDGADADHDVVEHLVREVRAIGVFLSLAIRDGIGVVHGQDEVAALKFHLLPDGGEQLVHGGFVFQFRALERMEEPGGLIMHGKGELIAADSATEGLFERGQVVLCLGGGKGDGGL